MTSRIFLAGALVVSSLAACAPIKDVRGYIPDEERVGAIKVGTDTRDSVPWKSGTVWNSAGSM